MRVIALAFSLLKYCSLHAYIQINPQSNQIPDERICSSGSSGFRSAGAPIERDTGANASSSSSLVSESVSEESLVVTEVIF